MRLHVKAGILLCSLVNLIHSGDGDTVVEKKSPALISNRTPSEAFKKIQLYARQSVEEFTTPESDVETEPASRHTSPALSPQPKLFNPEDSLMLEQSFSGMDYLKPFKLRSSKGSKGSMEELGSPLATPKALQFHGTTPPEDQSAKFSRVKMALLTAMRQGHPTTPVREHPTTPPGKSDK